MPSLILGHTTKNSIMIGGRGFERWPVAFIDVLDGANRRTESIRVIQLDADNFYADITKWDRLGTGSSYEVKVSIGKTLQLIPKKIEFVIHTPKVDLKLSQVKIKTLLKGRKLITVTQGLM